jgi:hypothetical protein
VVKCGEDVAGVGATDVGTLGVENDGDMGINILAI